MLVSITVLLFLLDSPCSERPCSERQSHNLLQDQWAVLYQISRYQYGCALVINGSRSPILLHAVELKTVRLAPLYFNVHKYRTARNEARATRNCGEIDTDVRCNSSS